MRPVFRTLLSSTAPYASSSSAAGADATRRSVVARRSHLRGSSQRSSSYDVKKSARVFKTRASSKSLVRGFCSGRREPLTVGTSASQRRPCNVLRNSSIRLVLSRSLFASRLCGV
ncbi:hypothetical protein MRX96_055835 [Rhipicephalus microplus]